MEDIKLFNKYSSHGIEVSDLGIKPYISIQPVYVPKTGARYAGSRFHKSKVSIVERLINKIMVTGHKGKKHKYSSGHNTGKAQKAYSIVETAFEIIEEKTGQNPLAVFVKAVENSAPREEIVTIEYGGARYPKAVESAPQRRIDYALRMIAQATYSSSFDSNREASSSLANEIIEAYKLSPKSQAISKKQDLERQADSAR